MIKKLFSLIPIFILPFIFNAQTPTIYYDIVNTTLNEGEPVPAETPFQIKSNLPDKIVYVELNIYKGEKDDKPDFTYDWKKPFNFKVNEFGIKVADPLRGSEQYSFEFKYYVKADMSQMQRLEAGLRQNLEAYIRSNFEIKRRRFASMTGKHIMMKNLNKIVTDGTSNYRHGTGSEFKGFSDIVAHKIDQIENTKLNKAKFNVFASGDKDSARVKYARQLIDELTDMVKSEASQYLNADMFVLADARTLPLQETENTPNYIALNFGYSGVHFGGNTNNLDYGTSPYAGISIPLGKLAFHRILSKTSFSAGLMLQNMEDAGGNNISGPVVGRPLYAALGFKTLKIFRFNAGAMVASQEIQSGNQMTENIKIYPFVGLAVELNMWLGFSRKK